MVGLLKDAKRVVMINAHVGRAWESQVNEELAAGVKQYPNAVLLDWHAYGDAHPEFFYDDGIHRRAGLRPVRRRRVGGVFSVGHPTARSDSV
jgi:hypothetical protein